MLLQLDNQEIAILEYGIDKTGEMDKLVAASLPNIAIITMIGTAHIGIIGKQDKIFKVKLDISKYMDKNCTLVLNSNDKYLNNYINDNINIIKYNIKDANDIKINGNSTKFETKIIILYIK